MKVQRLVLMRYGSQRMQTAKQLMRLLPGAWDFRIQAEMTLADSEPEPDLSIVRATPDDYESRHPGPADTGLIIEVADSSLSHDRNVKGPIYARAGIPIYWIVNVPDNILEVYTSPTATGYQTRQDFALTDVVPLVIAGNVVAQVPVADLIG